MTSVCYQSVIAKAVNPIKRNKYTNKYCSKEDKRIFSYSFTNSYDTCGCMTSQRDHFQKWNFWLWQGRGSTFNVPPGGNSKQITYKWQTGLACRPTGEDLWPLKVRHLDTDVCRDPLSRWPNSYSLISVWNRNLTICPYDSNSVPPTQENFHCEVIIAGLRSELRYGGGVLTLFLVIWEKKTFACLFFQLPPCPGIK